MPEGPEVRKYAIDLAKRVSDRAIRSVTVLSGRYLKKDPVGINNFRAKLPNRVVGVGVHGKFLYWIIENDTSIWCTLGLTGAWSETLQKNSRVKFALNDGDVYYNDTRNFGTLKFVEGRKLLIDKLTSLGPDLLAERCDNNLFIERFRTKNHKNVTEVMMNEKVVAGVGNYIKADALWLSGISPHRQVSSLSDQDLANLNQNIHKIMTTSFDSGGATIYSYKNFDGSLGEYGSKFLVYNRKQDPEGNEVIKETTKDKRTTHWSPAVQH